MYDYLRGTIAEKSPTHVVLDVGGMGFQIHAPLSTTQALPDRGEVKLWTWLHVREDILRVYGFASLDERRLFCMLQQVSGIGPRLANAILSRASVRDLADAISTGRTDFLKSLKGIGPKTAQRLVTELQGGLDGFLSRADPDASFRQPVLRDALQALEVLGCAPKAARQAVERVLATHPDLSVEDLVRRALRSM